MSIIWRDTEKLTSVVQKRKSTPDAGPSPKQPKLWEAKRVSQINVDKGIIDFVIQGLHPLSVVEQQGFIDLLLLLQPNLAVMSRGTLKNKVEKAAQQMKNNLKLALTKVEFIATTTDCWTAHRRGFIGVTAHWIDSATLQRCCAALACKQLKGFFLPLLVLSTIYMWSTTSAKRSFAQQLTMGQIL